MKELKELMSMCKRVLMAAQLGVFVYSADGHRWIETVAVNDNDPLEKQWFDKFGKPFNTKVYGGLVEALDYIDYLLKRLNPAWPGLESEYSRRDMSDQLGLDLPAVKTDDYFAARAGA